MDNKLRYWAKFRVWTKDWNELGSLRRSLESSIRSSGIESSITKWLGSLRKREDLTILWQLNKTISSRNGTKNLVKNLMTIWQRQSKLKRLNLEKLMVQRWSSSLGMDNQVESICPLKFGGRWLMVIGQGVEVQEVHQTQRSSKTTKTIYTISQWVRFTKSRT